MKYLLVDLNNVLFRTYFARPDEDDDTVAGLATHSALVTLNKYFKQHKPDKVVMAFDRNSWRKTYTASEQCVSQRPYKGNRRKDMSPSKQAKYKRFLEHISEFEMLLQHHTTIITLAAEHLEADDLIAGFIQQSDQVNDKIVVISSDSDLLQLLKFPNVTIITPDKDKVQALDKFNNDPEYYLFQKCVRGDPTDNVQSAYPRVRSTRIEKAYKDPFECVQMMKEIWKDENDREFIVEDLFNENRILIDLEQQPTHIREIITNNINEEMIKQRKFSLFYILQFIGKYQLVKIKENIDQYIPMLSK